MSPATEGSIVLVATLLMLVSGVPVAFGLGAISIIFLLIFQGFGSMHVVAETYYASLDEFTLVRNSQDGPSVARTRACARARNH